MRLFHFREDPGIERFVPHVPRTNPSHAARVWAIDEEHQAAYWFPRDCPRVTVWCDVSNRLTEFRAQFKTDARRLHVIEERHLADLRSTTLYRYEVRTESFVPWDDADGQWISEVEMGPVSVEPVGDLVALHRSAGIELRTVESLWPLRDEVVASDWPFSIIRMMHATPR